MITVSTEPRISLVRRDSEELVRLLVHLTLQLRDHERTCLEAAGLSRPQARALWALRPEHVLTVRALAESMRADASNLTTVLRELEDRGLVERGTAQHDRRALALQLTAAGEAARRGLIECLEPPSVAALDPADRERLIAILREIDRGTRS